MFPTLLESVCTRPLNTSSRYCRRAWLTSRRFTLAPSPSASLAAFVPTTPAPRMVMDPVCTPGTPAKSTPLPPCARSRKWAPTCGAMRPATSLMGVRSGSDPLGSCTVS